MKGWLVEGAKMTRYRIIRTITVIRTGRRLRIGLRRDSWANWYSQTAKTRARASSGQRGSANPDVKILVITVHASFMVWALKNIQAKVTNAKTNSCLTMVGTFAL